MRLLRAQRLESPARKLASTRKSTSLALIQEKWHGSQSAQMEVLASAARIAAIHISATIREVQTILHGSLSE
jgi:hypothetical protein